MPYDTAVLPKSFPYATDKSQCVVVYSFMQFSAIILFNEKAMIVSWYITQQFSMIPQVTALHYMT